MKTVLQCVKYSILGFLPSYLTGGANTASQSSAKSHLSTLEALTTALLSQV